LLQLGSQISLPTLAALGQVVGRERKKRAGETWRKPRPYCNKTGYTLSVASQQSGHFDPAF